MNKESVYLETTIISYLTARRSHDIIVLACQEMTQNWWNRTKEKYDLYVSERVINEISKGDASVSKIRLEVIKNLPVLQATPECVNLAELLLAELSIPKKAVEDAMHIAIAAVHEIDYLLTWNCKHLANAHIISELTKLSFKKGFKGPVLCTPQELMEEVL